MARSIKVLGICPRDHDHLILRMAAFHDGWDLSLARTFADAVALMDRTSYAIVLYDTDLPSPDWREAVLRLASPAYDRLLIVMAPHITDELWHRAMELGAFGVIDRPGLGVDLLSMISDARHFLEIRGIVEWGRP